MKFVFQLLVAVTGLLGSVVLLYLMATSELGFKDLKFATYFGLFAALAAISFFALIRNEDNEETNPGKEKAKK